MGLIRVLAGLRGRVRGEPQGLQESAHALFGRASLSPSSTEVRGVVLSVNPWSLNAAALLFLYVCLRFLVLTCVS